MIKTIALIRRRKDITREDFARHYEEIHAPLALDHLPMIKHYARNHVISVLVAPQTDFDCVSEFWFETIDDALKVQEFAQSGEGQLIRDDEARFMDSGRTLSFLVEEMSSPIDGPSPGPDAVKAIALLKGKPGLSRDEFIEHYEKGHAPLILEHSSGIKRYLRNYVLSLGDEDTPFDSLTEIWYGDQESYDKSMALRLSAAGKIIADDEASFLDTNRIAFLLVNERISR